MRGLICDDHPLMRKAFVLAMQGRWPELRLEEAADYPDALRLANGQPDFCIVDLAMPGAAPVEGVAALRQAAPDTRIIVLTGLTDQVLLDEVAALGVAAILPKTLDAHALFNRLETALPGLGTTEGNGLPPRQLEVLKLLAAGLTNKEIAIRLGIAPATVKVHVSRLINHLAAANRTDAVSKAQRNGLI